MTKNLKNQFVGAFCAAMLLFVLAGTALADQTRGPVTNLPLPRYVSLKASKANVRRGPSLTHRIDWVYTRRSMPLEITAEHGHWRRVRDMEGAGGWVHYSLLSGVRTVVVEQDMLPLTVRPESNTPSVAHLEMGVVARLGECNADWCKISSGGYKGWAPKEVLWGVSADELRE
ncbi:SH3 domain-containing protein [Shimia thalassica]|uniref:SH3 domain-containing protein n=1 Tax=Shimia thalassica TaxID=1715693 RepID=UPI003B00A00F